jgi:hypothetical protein
LAHQGLNGKITGKYLYSPTENIFGPPGRRHWARGRKQGAKKAKDWKVRKPKSLKVVVELARQNLKKPTKVGHEAALTLDIVLLFAPCFLLSQPKGCGYQLRPMNRATTFLSHSSIVNPSGP